MKINLISIICLFNLFIGFENTLDKQLALIDAGSNILGIYNLAEL